jgi:hypothetical protein
LIVGDLTLWVLFLLHKGILIYLWVEAIPTKSADGETSLKMLKDVIFPRFGVPRYLMTDGGSHFIHGGFRKILLDMMLIIELLLLIILKLVGR